MPRIDYPDREALHPKVRDALDALPADLNIFRISALAERNFDAMMRLGGTILGRQQLADNLRELAILRVAELSKARYEWVQHETIARQTGCSDEQIQALARGNTAAPCFDDKERALLDFTDEVLRDVRPSDASLAALRKHFTDREVMELTVAIGFYMLMARIMEVSGIEIEDSAAKAILEKTNEE